MVSIRSNVNRPKEVKNPRQLQFLTSAVNLQGCPADQVPEVAIVGRSNAGKSSLINALARARIAQISSTPGKTRLLNFYTHPRYRLVDMPGYGFAARGRDEKNEWTRMIEAYLAARANLVGLIIVMDIRRDWSEDEDNLLRWMAPRGLTSAVVLTKADKISRSESFNRARQIRKESGAGHVLVTSALKKQGFEELEKLIIKEWIESDEAPDDEDGEADA